MDSKLQTVFISVKSSTNSFFAEVSKRIDNRIILYVYKYPKDSLYYVIAYISEPLSTNLILEIARNYRNNILKMHKYTYFQETYLTIIKQRCEFYELLEDYNVATFVPYTIYKGQRIYCVCGIAKDIDRYVENMIAKYGRKNISIRNVDPHVCVEYQLKNIIDSYIFTMLTEKEKRLLMMAFKQGYISSRRKINLESLAESLDIAKPTASLMLRKAIEKILKRLIESRL
ncbi:helix-turn-helix domain-containing protein [Ignisphaera sp. 4213-co]|uniref:Helix-turn-helix domain-containing protein n=1 Tax=Ignisphaera cupida TaxID=3050454 RepID=A0ABD4Z847_9CREN|nr:helix-turn-helix domain-containing protein [Ignisphaera sp. 4213-co]MDK6029055.1 helix-turn-helix domain-containing protein [Ignisphaera sp. 4213-co]